MRYIRKCSLLLTAIVCAVMLASCGKDYDGDISKLNDLHNSIERRVSTLESQVTQYNTQLSQLTVMATAVEQGFYITKVSQTTEGYELTLSNNHVIILQSGPGNTLTPMPAISMTRIDGLFYWTLDGTFLLDSDGKPLRITTITPIVRYDSVTMQWLISVDGGKTFQTVNVMASVILNNTVLQQVINTYFEAHHETLLSQQMLYQIISTYIQQNYRQLFDVDLLNQIITTHVSRHYTEIFSYELMEKIFSQYNYEWATERIDVDRLTELLLTFIREHQEIFVSNRVLQEIVTNYIEVNKTTLFTTEMLLSVVNNFLENNENFINVELLRQVVFNFIEEHQDVVINNEVLQRLLLQYVQNNYVQIFSQDILVSLVSNYISKNKTTIFNETLIKEVINNYVKNNHTTIISNEQITEIVNQYLKVSKTTIIDRKVIQEVITNYFEKNYHLFIDQTTLQQVINNYIEQNKTTLIDIDVIEQILIGWLDRYYTEVFNYDMLTRIISNYFEENVTVINRFIGQHAGLISGLTVNDEEAVVTLMGGQTISLTVYDAYARLSNRVQSIVALPGANGKVGRDDGGNSNYRFLRIDYLISPSNMASVIQENIYHQEMVAEIKAVNADGEITTQEAFEPYAREEGILNIAASIPNDAVAVALHIYETRPGGTDIMTEFSLIGGGQQEQPSRGYKTCPDDHHPHLIDLGLPSGTLWACCNVGASAPHEYGGFYAWGETVTKNYYTQANYDYCTGPTDGKYYYNYQHIGSDISGTTYDAARKRMGENWCMPTKEQMEELINNTEYSWELLWDYTLLRLTGKNGGSIVLPAAGYNNGQAPVQRNNVCAYWTSTLDEVNGLNNINAFYLDAYHNEKPWIDSHTGLRYYGYSIRAVERLSPEIKISYSY